VLTVRTTYIRRMRRQTLGRLVQQARERKGWTQEVMAEQTGVSRSTIANIESGVTKLPKTQQLEAIERHLDLSKEEMLRAAGRLDMPEDDVLEAMQQIDRLSTEAERLAVFRSLPASVQRAIRKLSADFLQAATEGLLESGVPHVDHR
jgi:transcriptional regulator with XRE-family HTH domain